MDRFTALYFNGESPVPVQALLYATDAALHLDAADGSFSLMFPWDEVLDCRDEKGRVVITLPGATVNSPASHREIVCQDSEAAGQIIPRMLKHRRSLFSFRGNLFRTALVFALLGIIFTAAMWGLMTHGYTFVSIDAEKQIGGRVIAGVLSFSKEYTDKTQSKKLAAMVARVKPSDSPYTYTVHLIENPQINAFAVPGGDILVFRGLLDAHPSDAELAGVLAHEVSHVELRHGIRQMIRFMGISYLFHIAGGAGLDQMQGIDTINNLSSLLVLFKYSRSYELEADANAVRLLKKGRYSSQGLSLFLRRMEKTSAGKEPPEYLSTHPATAERIRRIERITQQ